VQPTSKSISLFNRRAAVRRAGRKKKENRFARAATDHNSPLNFIDILLFFADFLV